MGPRFRGDDSMCTDELDWYEKPLAQSLSAADIEDGCPRMRDKTRIAIATGDPAGIGPEISLGLIGWPCQFSQG